MRFFALSIAILSLACSRGAAAEPMAAEYLRTGQLAKGEQALQWALAAAPGDDQIRFGLGVIQFVRGVERLAQSLHEYGLKPRQQHELFLRLPLPPNADPAPITHAAYRRLFDDFLRDLATAEATLAAIQDDNGKLPLKLAEVRLDLDSDGQATDKLTDIIHRVMGRNLALLKDNPDFLVCFDRGDVAWLRAYCHLLMGLLDAVLSLDTKPSYELSARDLFASPKDAFSGTKEEEEQKRREIQKLTIAEPVRLGRFRRHLIQVAVLNQETWKFIRSETDDDHEWLPNPAQRGVLGLQVRESMIDAWLKMMDEFKALLEGECTLPPFTGLERDGQGLNLQVLLDDPPPQLDFSGQLESLKLDPKYFSRRRFMNLNALGRVFSMFSDPSLLGYPFWFN